MEPGAVFRDYVSSETERGSPTPRCCCWFDLEKVVGVVVQNCRISSIDFNKNSSYMVTASDDDSIRLYDVATATWVDIYIYSPTFNLVGLVGWCWMSMYNNSLFFGYNVWLDAWRRLTAKSMGLILFASLHILPLSSTLPVMAGTVSQRASEHSFFLHSIIFIMYDCITIPPSLFWSG